ncbi:hypothetical protein ACJ73_04422 [Blastomyces percursus]|uniref:C2H2-type domain-containing protein n=1 Tax=Blastomyces percursus TaxID=1658174 RepID=A0A1J9Q668_9EURO|nr:hypothetical protein ACJ73_04422 [Blastomyces percursus]
MPKKLTPEERDRRAEEHGFNPDERKVDQKPILSELQPCVKNGYEDMWQVWKHYNKKYGPRDIHNEDHKQKFIEYIARTTKGKNTKGKNPKIDPRPMPSAIWKPWKRFTAQWARETGEKLPHHVTNSGTNFIFQELHKHIPLNLEIRERDYVTLKHFKVLLQQLWYVMYSSARVGEYVESSARHHSGRGLYLPEDMTFLVIHNHKGRPEIIIRPKRDAKNMSKKEKKHPRHPMQEDIESLPMYLNPVLEPLAICLARGIFRDFKTVDDIFALEPPPGEDYELALGPPTIQLYGPNLEPSKEAASQYPSAACSKNKAERRTPFFEKVSAEGLAGEILTASWLDDGLANLGHRAGYGELISFHDMRAEALVRTNENEYGIEALMQFAGHGGNPRIYYESYMSSTSSVQGVSNILKLQRRGDMAEPFRGLTLQRHPKMWQALPAKLQQDLEDSPECAKLNNQIRGLTERIKMVESAEQRQALEARRHELYNQKHQLAAQELDTWQRLLCKEHKPGIAEEDDHSLSYHWTWFDRVAHLMPERSRLSELLLLPVPLRSREGREALDLMIKICKQKRPVSDHPALKPDKGHCPDCSISLDNLSTPATRKRWKHVYRHRRQSLKEQHGYAALCFICHQWVTNKAEFEQHCQHHLDHPETIPLQYGYLDFQGMLASLGYSPIRLLDTTMSASERMKPFLDLQTLKRDLEKYYAAFGYGKAARCGLHCDMLFNSLSELQHHLHDVHCIPVPKRRMGSEYKPKAEQPDLPQFKSNVSGDFNVQITNPESLKRKHLDSGSSETEEPKQKRPRRGSTKSDPCEETQPPASRAPEGCLPVSASQTCSRSADSGYYSPGSSGAAGKWAGHGTMGVSSIPPNIDPRLFEETSLDDRAMVIPCPVCQCDVSILLYKEYSTEGQLMSGCRQLQLCKAHRRETAKQDWIKRQYPRINWGDIDRRLT